MRDNPDNHNVGNLVGKETDKGSILETPLQSKIALKQSCQQQTSDPNKALRETQQLGEIAC